MVNREITTATPEGALALMVYAHATGDKKLREEVAEELPEAYRWHTIGPVEATDEERVHHAVSAFGMFGFDPATRKGIEELAKEHSYAQPWLTILLDKVSEETHRRRQAKAAS